MVTAGRHRDDGAAVGGGVERGRRESMAASVLLFGFATRRGFRSAFGDLPFASLFHGIDERVPVEGLQFGVRVLDRFLAAS